MNSVYIWGAAAFVFINAICAAKYWKAGRAGWAGAFTASLIFSVMFLVGLRS